MNDRSPSPRSSRGLSTLCPPRLFSIGDRRHGQSVDNPANRSAIDPVGGSFFVSPRGQYLMSLDSSSAKVDPPEPYLPQDYAGRILPQPRAPGAFPLRSLLAPTILRRV